MSGRVLVADGDLARGDAIADACRALGIEARSVMHGAGALEAALDAVPDALVCQLGLPLIDGARLASILRANPRTREIVTAFLADRPHDDERSDLGGALLAPGSEPGLVARWVRQQLDARAAEETPDPACEADPAESGTDAAALAEGNVEGELQQLPLPELLELFHVGRRTGTVELTRGLGRSRRQVGRIMLLRGDLVHAAVDQVEGKKALFRLLGWDRGGFALDPTLPEVPHTIQAPTRPLLREGLRQLREWERLAVELPPMTAEVSLVVSRAALPNVIHPLTQEVLMVLDLCSHVQDVVDQCTYPDYQVLRTLHTLVQRGMVELRVEPEVPGLAHEESVFSPPRVARLRDWLAVDRPGAIGPLDAKLLLVVDQPLALQDFARLLSELPGAELDVRAEAGGVDAYDLMRVGRVAVDPEIGIELVHVPSDPQFAPIWPLAARGALGALVLLSGSDLSRLSSLGAATAALSTAPRARVFHLLLLDKGEPLVPEELRRHAGVIDEASLVLLPLEQPDKARVLLRETLGRVLP